MNQMDLMALLSRQSGEKLENRCLLENEGSCLMGLEVSRRLVYQEKEKMPLKTVITNLNWERKSRLL